MNIITKEELREKLERGDAMRLLMALDRNAFEQLRIPGSIHFSSMDEAARQLAPDEAIVIYCSNPLCPVSVQAYRALERRGFTNLYRYAGGITEWMEAGYPLEGSQVPA